MDEKIITNELPTEAQTQKFDLLYPLISATLGEIREFSKKKQDDVLNKMKVRIINQLLSKVRDVLAQDPSIEFLELLDDETLPSNSDAVLVISHYKASMELFKEKYFGFDSGTRRWFTKERPRGK